MQTAFKKTSVVALLGAMLAAGAFGAAPAPASTGGASAGGAAVPGTAAPAPRRLARGASIATWFGPGFYGQRTACGPLLAPAGVGVPKPPPRCGELGKLGHCRPRPRRLPRRRARG